MQGIDYFLYKWYTIITKDYKKEKEKSLETLIFQAFLIIGATGFEPATSASRTQRSTKLSHAPFHNDKVDNTIFHLKIQVRDEKI